jgi:hypothetical protein
MIILELYAKKSAEDKPLKRLALSLLAEKATLEAYPELIVN